MKTALYIVATLALAGCANSSGVLKVGPNSYTISTSASPGKGGVPAAKRLAYEDATAACVQQDLELLTLSEKSKSPTWTEGMATMELNFRCLKKDDPEFQRQRLQSSPDEVIENRQR